MAPNQKRVAVIVLNWNRPDTTIACLDSIHSTDGEAIDIVVVDNGSTDDSLARIGWAHPEVIVLPLDRNDGFARGVNHGLRWILTQKRHEVIVFLNNDAKISGKVLLQAADLLLSAPQVGLLTGKILASNGKIWYGGGSLRHLTGSAVIFGQQEPDRGQCDVARDVTFATLAFSLVRRSIVEEVGLLAEEYFFGQEEWDYSVRVRRAGFRLRYEPRIVCTHGGDGSHDNSAPEFIYNGYRNKLIFQQTYLPQLAFKLWRGVFSFYARTILPHRVRRLHEQELSPAVLRLCALQALRDQTDAHRPVEEQDLERFRLVVGSVTAP